MLAMNIQSEEDVKIKIVIPYLLDLGFISEELELETNFHLKFGKSVIPIGAKKPKTEANARLDILVKYQGTNICVFEVKRDSVVISADDIAQAVSYGSLVKPTVPFCIVTNGENSVIVDTISGIPFDGKDIEKYKVNGYKVVLPEEVYYERIKHFLGYSKENLLKFCEMQVSQYIKPLKGSKEKKNNKYIPEIYEPSEIITDAVNDFLGNDSSSSFVLVAKSGMGKTCWACSTAEKLLDMGIPILFYPSKDVKDGIFEAIIEDLNWELSPQLDVVQGMRRFFDIFNDATVCIVLDGLDELGVDLAYELTEKFLRRIENRNVKLLTTCKTEIWPDLQMIDGTPSRLAEVAFKRGISIDVIDDVQFFKLIEKYRQFYHFNGIFQQEVIEDCKRNLFLLRIMFEVAEEENFQHLSYSSAVFFQKYYKRVISKNFEKAQQESTQNILCQLAKLLFEKNCDYVDMQDVRKYLGLNALESLPEKLFLINVLDRRSGAHFDEVGFYFQRFRDYITAFYVCKWQNVSPEQFKEQVFKSFLFTGVRLNVLELYYTLADECHKRVLDNMLYDKALGYVEFYENLLNTFLLPLKEEFKPYTCDEIGIVGYFDIIGKNMLMHGFRSISKSDPKVILIPASGRDWQNHDDRASELGANAGLHMAFPSCFTQNMNIAKCVIKDEIIDQIKMIIARGNLDETQSITLLSEKLFAIGCIDYPNFVGADPKFNGVTIKGFALGKLKEGVLVKRAHRFLKHELVERKINTGEIPVHYSKGTATYSETLSSLEKDELCRQAIQIGKAGKFYSSSIIFAAEEKFEQQVLDEIKIFEQAGIAEILDPLVTRREDPMKFHEMYWGHKSDEEYAKKFLCELLEIAYKEYKGLIDRNFPLMRNSFKLIDEKPVKMFVSFIPRDRGLIYKLLVAHPIIEEANCDFSVEAREEILKQNWDSRDEFVEIAEKKYKILYCKSGLLSNFLMTSTNFHTFKSTEYLTVIRNLVYKLISENIDSLIGGLAEQFGVTLNKTEGL